MGKLYTFTTIPIFTEWTSITRVEAIISTDTDAEEELGKETTSTWHYPKQLIKKITVKVRFVEIIVLTRV